MAQLVDLASADAGLHEGTDVVQHFAGKPTGYAHFFDFLRGLDTDGHNYSR
jgi:hypothetical protein